MGLFSHSVTQVGTMVSRVVEDKLLPNSLITGALKAQIEDDGQIMEHAIEELGGGLGTRIHQYFKYGRDHYANGLPSGTTMTNLMGRSAVIDAIESEVGAGINLNYYHVGPINLMHLGWSMLVSQHGYDSSDNSLTYNDRKVYLTDMKPVVKDATIAELESGIMDRWGMSPLAGVTPQRRYAGVNTQPDITFLINPDTVNDYLLVDCCWEEDAIKVVEGVNVPYKKIVEAQFTMDIVDLDMQASYHQAGYNDSTRNGFWTYKIGSNANPAVEAIFTTEHKSTGTFFPMAHVRFNKAAITSNDPEYATTKRLMKIISMNFDKISDSLSENPDIAQVEQAFLTLGVPAVTENELERRYLFDFFDNLWGSSERAGASSLSITEQEIAQKLFIERPQSAIIIEDKKFKMALRYTTIIKHRVAGKVAEVGMHHSDVNFKVDEKTTQTVMGIRLDFGIHSPTHIYQRQLTETVYEEIMVRDLSMTYYIYGDYTTTGDNQDEKILLIPLDYGITSAYTIPDREVLYARALHFVFNSRVVTHLKWYETGLFKVVLVIIAVVITILSYGETFELIGAALAAGEVVAALILLIPILVEMIVVRAIFKKVVKMIGGKLALILAAVAMAFGVYQISMNGGLAGAPWATELLQVSTNLSNAAGMKFREEYQEVLVQFKTFQEYKKEQEDKVKSAEELLNNNVHLVPMVIFGESPDDFYQRTVHSGNIGMMGIEAISSYVDVALTLPKLSETIGEAYV